MNDTEVRAAEVDAPLEQLKQKIESERPVASSTGRVVAWLSLLLIIILIATTAGAVYWLWPQWQTIQQQQQMLQQNQQRLTEQSHQQQESQQQLQQQVLSEQHQQVQQLKQNLQQQQQQLAEQNQIQMQALRQLVQERDSAPPRHWILAETEYLLQLAAQKAWLQQDFASATALLASADEKLANLDDPSLMPIREAISKDKQQLSQLTQPDLSQIHLQLQTMRQQVQHLPLKQQEQALNIEQSAPDNDLANWRNTLHYYWQQSWSKLIRVRKAVPEDYFSLSAEQQLMVRLSLNQQLMLAEISAMQQQPQVYRAALQQAADQLQRYFDSNHSQVQQLSQQLADLAAKPVESDQPSVLLSLKQLQQYQQQLTESSL